MCIWKPSVGDMSDVSSLLNFFSIVVFPALSRPRTSRRISFSLAFSFLMMFRRPIVEFDVWYDNIVVDA